MSKKYISTRAKTISAKQSEASIKWNNKNYVAY